ERILLWHADLGEQRSVGFCRVGDRRFGDPAPQLLHDDLALLLAVDPLVISREPHANRLHALGRAEVDGDGLFCIKHGSLLFTDRSRRHHTWPRPRRCRWWRPTWAGIRPTP